MCFYRSKITIASFCKVSNIDLYKKWWHENITSKILAREYRVENMSMKTISHQKTLVWDCYIDNFSTIKTQHLFRNFFFVVQLSSFIFCSIVIVISLSLFSYRCSSCHRLKTATVRLLASFSIQNLASSSSKTALMLTNAELSLFFEQLTLNGNETPSCDVCQPTIRPEALL